MNNFLNWAKTNAPPISKSLRGKTPGTEEFNETWKSLAERNSDVFGRAQHDFIKQSHFDPAAETIHRMVGVDVSKKPQAIQDVVWSTAVQHGPAGAARIFRSAGITPDMSDEEIIRRVYAERSAEDGKKYFPSSSENIRKSVVRRFANEMADALLML